MVPAEKVEAVDTTAAGDVFTAVMTYVYLQNGNIVSAVKYATCAAALSVTREGASTSIPTRAEVIAYAKKKTGKSADNQIDAISGATITTNAVVKCVNGAITAVKTVEGGAS